MSIFNSKIEPIISTGNSTTETLSSGATFTGSWETTSGNPDAQIWVKASQNATVFIEFSPDGGTTVDQFPFGGVALTSAFVPYYDQVVVGVQSFRVRVENTSGVDNDIILMVGYGNLDRPSSIISTGMNSQSGSINTKAVIFGEDINDSTSLIPVKVASDGAIRTSIISSLISFAHDYYVKVNASTTTDRFDYYVGGSGGTKVAEILITYESTSKNEVLSAGVTLI